jgi:ADP-L-glycero-D-manno-heptose 6-epimerase
MILVTGGAGFIGSYLQAEFFARGYETVVVDRLGTEGKWRNIARHPPSRIIAPAELDDFLQSMPPIEMVFHMGAISETLATDGDQVWRTNVELSSKLWHSAPSMRRVSSMPPRPPPMATGIAVSMTIRRCSTGWNR